VASRTAQETHTGAVVVGAGFGGMYTVYRLRELGIEVQGVEAGDDVGGTWYWNRYPGARCDVESMEYSYSFDEDLQQEWEWSERYSPQPEILNYANHVADRFDLRPQFLFGTKVISAYFNDESRRWSVTTDSGRHFVAQYLVLATGMLSSANTPTFEGFEDFEGEVYHTAQWPHDGVDFSGKRLGVIGTGSSGIQAIPVIAQQAGHVTVFQRTPNYSIPARNGPLDPQRAAEIKSRYPEFREANRQQSTAFGSDQPRGWGRALEVDEETRTADFETRWQAGGFGFLRGYTDLMLNPESNETAAQFTRRKIAETVRDPATAKLLTPSQVIGCKRICVDTNYFETYNQTNVDLVDVSLQGLSFTSDGITVGDRHTAVDVVVLATGFDAMTGSISKIDIRGSGGLPMAEKWEAGPVNFLGLSVAGFPNMFMITGPGSPSVLTNMIVSIEQHVDWIANAVKAQAADGFEVLDASREAETRWVGHVNAIADMTLFPTCNSWYLGANVPGKPRVFMPLIGFPEYAKECDRIAAEGYEGFIRT
jgi:cation diffusion facilitator CzcD-associated flavoprotein CzcO